MIVLLNGCWSISPPFNKSSICAAAPFDPSDEPLLLWFLDGFWVVGADDGRVGGLSGRLAAAFGLVGVVGAFVAEHVADEEDQRAQDGEDHHGDDACRQQNKNC